MARASFRDHKRLVRGVNQFLQLLHCDCINGFAIGRKRTAGKNLKDLAIVVYVNEKLSLRRLPLSNRIPRTLSVPDDRAQGGVLEFITDVQAARFNALEYTQRERPARSGISVGHVNITAGTLGGLVRDRVTGDVVILSNNHVLAESNDATIGDPVLQPGPADGGQDPRDRIARLTRFAPIDFAPGAENRVDCAIATPDPGDVLWNTVDVGPGLPVAPRRLDESDLGEFVQKTGRTTEHTQGFVQALFGTVQVKYSLFQKATFVDQIIVSQAPSEEEFSSGGDSGSLVYDSDGACIGLLFGGSQGTEEQPGTTIINPIHFVTQALDIELLSPGDHPTGAEQAAPRSRTRAAKKKAARKRTPKKAAKKKAARKGTKKAAKKKTARKSTRKAAAKRRRRSSAKRRR
jgi:hypothetical protein